MALFLRIATLAAMLFSLVACGTESAPRHKSMASFPYGHTGFDLKFAWKTIPSTQGIMVDGVLRNLRYPQIESLNLFVALLDKDRKVLAEEAVFPIPQVIKGHESRPFALMLKKGALAEGEKLQFLVWYRASEGGDGGYHWLSSFTADAVTGVVLPEEPRASYDY